jgi:hypothetical protein
MKQKSKMLIECLGNDAAQQMENHPTPNNAPKCGEAFSPKALRMGCSSRNARNRTEQL